MIRLATVLIAAAFAVGGMTFAGETGVALSGLAIASAIAVAAIYLMTIPPVLFLPLSAVFAGLTVWLQSFQVRGFNYMIYESLIARIQDPNALLGDYYVNVSIDLNGYFVYAHLLALVPMDTLPLVYFTVWIVVTVAIGWFIYCAIDRVFDRHTAMIAAPIVLAFMLATYRWGRFGAFTLGDNALLTNFAQAQVEALAFALFGFLLLIQNRWIWAGLLVGAATLFHLNTGQHALLIWPIAALAAGIRLKHIAGFIAIALVVSLPYVGLALADLIATLGQEPTFSYIESSGWFRHPHHLIPSTWAWEAYLRAGIFWVVGAIAYALKFPKKPIDHALLTLVIVSFVLFAGAWIFVELIPIDFAAKTQLSRVTVLIKIVIAIYLGGHLARAIQLGWNKLRPRFETLQITGRWRPAALPLTVLGLALVLAAGATRDGHGLVRRAPTPLESAAMRVSPADAVFAVPPRYGQFAVFTLHAKRGVFADVKRFPFQGTHGSEWLERLCAIVDEPCETFTPQQITALHRINWDERYNSQGIAHWQKLAERYGITHLIRKSNVEWDGPAPVATEGGYDIVDLRGE